MLEPVKISLDALHLSTLMPMLMAVAGGLVILTIDLIKENLHKSLYVMLTMLIIFIDLGTTIGLNVNDRGFFDLMLVDGISIITQIIILVASILFIPLALTSKRFHEYSYPEFFALFLFMLAGLQFMVSSDNLILIFIGLETSSLALYTLIALHNRHHSFEAAVKYFTMGALAAGFFTMGSAILYAISGSLELGQIADILQTRMGDIGMLFPDNDAQYKGIDSKELLKIVVTKLNNFGFVIVNADITIAAQTPRIAKYKLAMRKTLAAILGIDTSRMNVKATTTEKLGFIGRSEGVGVIANANLKYLNWKTIG